MYDTGRPQMPNLLHIGAVFFRVFPFLAPQYRLLTRGLDQVNMKSDF